MIELLRKTGAAGGRFSIRLGAGDRLRIVDLEGRQDGSTPIEVIVSGANQAASSAADSPEPQGSRA